MPLTLTPEAARQFHESRIKHCKSCGAPIVWFRTPAGKNMPVEADTVKPEDEKYDWVRHTSHFANCAQADQHRRRTTTS